MNRTLLAGVAVAALTVASGAALAQTSAPSQTKPDTSTSAPSTTDTKQGTTGSPSGKSEPSTSQHRGQSEKGAAETHDRDRGEHNRNPQGGSASGQTTDKADAKPNSSEAPRQTTSGTGPSGEHSGTRDQERHTGSGSNQASPDQHRSTSGTSPETSTRSSDTKAPGTGTGTSNHAPTNAQAPSSSGSGQNTGNRETNAGSVNLSHEQQTRVSEAFSKVDARPVTNVNFSVSVGTTIPASVEVHELPASIVSIVPQFRGYDYVVVRDEIVIVEPHTKKIVYVIHRGGGKSSSRRSINITGEKLTSVKRSLISSGPRVTKTITIEDDSVIPQDVDIRPIPETIVTEYPELRGTDYFVENDRVVIVDPSSRHVVDILR